jgi:2-(3-amino-3-carboxypropyl)histidine synthase
MIHIVVYCRLKRTVSNNYVNDVFSQCCSWNSSISKLTTFSLCSLSLIEPHSIAVAFDEMKRLRYDAIQYAAKNASIFGIILGTLGRQGNPAIVQRIQETIKQAKRKYFVVLLSEITPQKLQLLSTSYNKDKSNVLCWVQVACPRLSVDWGHSFHEDEKETGIAQDRQPAATLPTVLLNPYELFVCLEQTEWQTDTYPMDYYSATGGPWTNYHASNKDRKINPTVSK